MNVSVSCCRWEPGNKGTSVAVDTGGSCGSSQVSPWFVEVGQRRCEVSCGTSALFPVLDLSHPPLLDAAHLSCQHIWLPPSSECTPGGAGLHGAEQLREVWEHPSLAPSFPPPQPGAH